MKIAILETEHFQYALTQSALFPECEQVIITTKQMMDSMLAYEPKIKKNQFEMIEAIDTDELHIIEFLERHAIDLFLISPLFHGYGAMKRILKKVKCTKVLTTHNINTWFNARFWSPKSFMDRQNMRAIIKLSDYIAVEDFIYDYLKNSNHPYFQKHKFIYIPFTLFEVGKEKKISKSNRKLKIVLTGALDGNKRRYEDVLSAIEEFRPKQDQLCFSFAGVANDSYGKQIQEKLREIRNEAPGYVTFFEDNATVEMFREEMETSDLVLSTSTETFKGMGTVEYIGKTKPTAAIHDMLTYQLPGLLPAHLKVPKNLEGSVHNYADSYDLKTIIGRLLNDDKMLEEWTQKAKENSLNFTPNVIRKQLPF